MQILENTDIQLSLLKSLIYFDIFSYPLYEEEIYMYCDIPDLDVELARKSLEGLKQKGLIHKDRDLYYLGKESNKIDQRLEGNRLASIRIKTARKYAAIIANFPFVRGVFISGSLSKNFMTPKSDIDFFIITQPGKLWLCRMLLTLFKKIFLLNSYRNFCINYFIDTNSLSIPDRNAYTANETAFLIPMYNYKLYLEFMELNNWYREYFPHILERSEEHVIRPLKAKWAMERIFDNKIGERLDEWCYLLTTKYLRTRFKNFDKDKFDLSLRSKKNVSKHHPNDFQGKVLKIYTERITELEKLA